MATKASKKGAKAAPPSPANTLEDHSVSPAEMAEKTGATKGRAAAATATAKADTKTAEKIVAETKSEAETKADSLADKIAKSGLIYHEDQLTGSNFIAEAQAEQCKGVDHRCRHTPLVEHEPRTGETIYPKGGAPFSVPMDTPRGQGAMGWLALRGADGQPFL